MDEIKTEDVYGDLEIWLRIKKRLILVIVQLSQNITRIPIH